MRRPLSQFILLGLICQGLAWDNYLLPGAFAVAWALLLANPGRLTLGASLEGPLLVVGCLGGYLAGEFLGYSTHFFLGHGLALVQLARLTRPLNHRERFVCVVIGLFHLAVACTFLVDYRFILVIAATVWLLPRTLAEIEVQSFSVQRVTNSGMACPEAPRIGAVPCLLIGVLTVGFFLVFPRASWSGSLPFPGGQSRERDTLLDTVVDPVRSAGLPSRRILFQVEGERLGYLRCYALTDFDGRQWKEDRSAGGVGRAIPLKPPSGEFLQRTVRVKNPMFLGNVAPVDGYVVGMRSTFFGYGYYSLYGMVITSSMSRNVNNTYEYWIPPVGPREDLRRGLKNRLTECPIQSEELKGWLGQTLRGVDDPYDQARHLERYFQKEFTYELGAPVLDRLNPVEDFVLRERKGHCERFAAALSALLRMRGIPSRVVIGYLPSSRNWITGRYDVRLCDAHAWSEAWFPERGWVRFDATPAATVPRPSIWRDWLEAADFAWYANVVNYDAPTQTVVLNSSMALLRYVGGWSAQHVGFLALLPLALMIWWLARKRGLPGAVRRVMPGVRSSPRFQARHFYGRMLRHLARQGYHRRSHETPLEFLSVLRAKAFPHEADAERLTRLFCAIRYGNQPLRAVEQREIEDALRRLQQACAPSSPSAAEGRLPAAPPRS